MESAASPLSRDRSTSISSFDSTTHNVFTRPPMTRTISDIQEANRPAGNEYEPEEEKEEDYFPETIRPSRRRSTFATVRTDLSAMRLLTQVELLRTISTRASDGEVDEVRELLAEMFGQNRAEHNKEERSRHAGVIFKHLTVLGDGLGAELQATVAKPLHSLASLIASMFARDPKIKPARTLLDDFNGCIRAGEMLLVLGRPGSGCSTFLKCIGNQRHGYRNISGEVTYGGLDLESMRKYYRHEIFYNPEHDLHYPSLTVKDTLKFALRTRVPAKEARRQGESRQEYILGFLRMVARLFWIEHVLNSRIGNDFIRGVSGGEKKRVSIAEGMIAKATTQCWDNSTRGLDASTAREYVKSLRALTNMAEVGTAAALYQLDERSYTRFDKVLLIDEGHCAYFGPTDEACQYFKGLGFDQPARWTTTDFLTSVTDPTERCIRPGYEDKVPRTAAEFGDIFRKSDVAKRNMIEIERYESSQWEKDTAKETPLTSKRKNYPIAFYRQILACAHRQFLVIWGDKQSLTIKWGGVLFHAIMMGALFYDLPKTAVGVFPRGGMLWALLLNNAFIALAELSSTFESRNIILKHKSFSFYRPSAYAMGQSLVDAPLVLIQVCGSSLVAYFMANLQRDAGHFFTSVLFLWVTTMTMYAFFRAIGAVFSSLDSATKVTGLAVQALVVYTGYLIPPTKMVPWLSWLRWLNPCQYAFEGLLANEFGDLVLQCVGAFIVPNVPGARPEYQSCSIQGSTPGTLLVDGERYIEVAYGYNKAHIWRNFGIICGFFVLFLTIMALGLESKEPNSDGGAVVVFQRGREPNALFYRVRGGPNIMGSSYDSRKASVVSAMTASSSLSTNTVFSWRGIHYYIPYMGMTRTLLQDQQGFAKPGTLTALMGASGAGKTTLLNALAQRLTVGAAAGEFLVDGKPLPLSFQRSTGFAEQVDIHEPTATVREALRFAARLRQPNQISLEEKYSYVENLIDMLEMTEIAGAIVGTPYAGLSLEQRKRLTIGVELASRPKLLMFLDEPTSGLDSSGAFNIIRILKKLAAAGQAIVCTIHQPSPILFEQFDELILLQASGRTVYHGPLGVNCSSLLDYFDHQGARRCFQKENPAEYILDVIGAGNPKYQGQNWGDAWAMSSERKQQSETIQEIIDSRKHASDSATEEQGKEFAMPLFVQFRAVLWRRFAAYWRMPRYIAGKFLLHVFTGLLNMLTFFKLGHSRIDMQSRLFSIFQTLCIAPPLIQQLQPKFLDFRQLFETRESRSKTYSWIVFTAAAIAVEIPYALAAGTLYWVCWYFGVGFPDDSSSTVLSWMYLMVLELFYTTFGQVLAALSTNELFASLLVPIFFQFIVRFCGAFVPPADLPGFWKAWMYPLSPFRYLLEGLLGIAVHKVPVHCNENELATFYHPPEETCTSYAGAFAKQEGGYLVTLRSGICGYCPYSSGDDYARNFNVFYANRWRDFGISWLYVFFNIGLIFLFSWLWFEGWQKMKRVSKSAFKRELQASKKPKSDKAAVKAE